MRLHENKELFADAIQAASRGIDDGGLGIRDIFIEKDYWICRSLRLMALADTNGQAVHKGGTSLSKAYGIGARFSYQKQQIIQSRIVKHIDYQLFIASTC